MMDNYELQKEDGQWKLQQQGASRAIKVFPTKDKGLDFSTDYVGEHGGSLKIKKENGRVQEERTYPRKADPRRTPG